MLLAIAGFSLSLLGTFLVRSGVLTSVHAFATDPARGTYILIFLLIVIGGSLTLFAARAHRIGLGLIIIGTLLVMLPYVIVVIRSADKLAGRLLIPYRIWVGYATYLNAGYWWLNR